MTQASSAVSRRPWGYAVLALAFLGPFFFLVYGSCNALAALRPSVTSLYLAWEVRLPFVPWMILPYMSIDLFYAASVFLCENRRELRAIVLRIVFCIMASAFFFIAFPLRFSFPIPSAAGWQGDLFRLLHAFDQPFNQAPSLHISLLVVLWEAYRRRLAGICRLALDVWFALIAASPLLTYQHHFIDIPTGAIVGFLALWLVREGSWIERAGPPAGRNPGGYYTLGGTALAATAAVGVGGGGVAWLFLMWPALSLGALAGAYFGLGARALGKQEGRFGFPSLVLLWPYLAGALASWRLQTTGTAPWREVCPGVLAGRRLTRGEARRALSEGVTAVLDLAAEIPEQQALKRCLYVNIPVLDLTVPTAIQLSSAVAFLESHMGKGKVLVHCALGRGRTAWVIAAYLMKTGRAATPHEAIALTKKMLPAAVLPEGRSSCLSEAIALMERGSEAGRPNDGY